jgi:hypothetical protein
VSRRSASWLASLLTGVAAGLCHAMTAVFLKLTVENLFHCGGVATALDWPLYALAASALSGMLLGQIAFASGPLPPAIAAMSVTNPVASFALGMLAFDTPVPTDPGVVAAIAASLAMIALGVIGLANASNTRRLYHAADDGDTDVALRDVGDTAEPDMRRRAVL